MRPDGSLLVNPGYDDETGLLYLPSGDFPPILENPGQHQAELAVDELLYVVKDFPFASRDHQYACLAALITPLVIFAIEGPCPLFLVDANVPSAGENQTYRCHLHPRDRSKMARSRYQSDDVEMDKTLLSIAMAGDRLVLI